MSPRDCSLIPVSEHTRACRPGASRTARATRAERRRGMAGIVRTQHSALVIDAMAFPCRLPTREQPPHPPSAPSSPPQSASSRALPLLCLGQRCPCFALHSPPVHPTALTHSARPLTWSSRREAADESGRREPSPRTACPAPLRRCRAIWGSMQVQPGQASAMRAKGRRASRASLPIPWTLRAGN